MKDPERLLESGATAAERRLLGAGAAEEPPPDGAARLAALIVPPSGGGAPPPETVPPPAAPGAPFALGAKWVIVGAGAAAAFGAALALSSRPAETRAPAASGAGEPSLAVPASEPSLAVPASTPSLAVPAGAPPADGTVQGAAPVVESAAVEPVEAVPPVPSEIPRRHVESGSIGGAPSIAREIRALDRVRALLARGDGRRALAELDRYRVEAPRGALGQEATLLRIEALVAAGDKQGARRLAQRFLSEHPGTPHATRVRALTGAPSP